MAIFLNCRSKKQDFEIAHASSGILARFSHPRFRIWKRCHPQGLARSVLWRRRPAGGFEVRAHEKNRRRDAGATKGLALHQSRLWPEIAVNPQQEAWKHPTRRRELSRAERWMSIGASGGLPRSVHWPARRFAR